MDSAPLKRWEPRKRKEKEDICVSDSPVAQNATISLAPRRTKQRQENAMHRHAWQMSLSMQSINVDRAAFTPDAHLAPLVSCRLVMLSTLLSTSRSSYNIYIVVGCVSIPDLLDNYSPPCTLNLHGRLASTEVYVPHTQYVPEINLVVNAM